MGKYLITLVMHETYELTVDADTEQQAWDIAGNTDIDYFNSKGIITHNETIEEVTNG
jgi:hypothetical protein